MNVQIIRFVDIWLKRLCLKIFNTACYNKELVSQDFSTVKRRKFLLCPKEQRAPDSFNVQICVVMLKMLRDMLIDIGAKKLMIEGQGECVPLRRACWTAWPPGSP